MTAARTQLLERLLGSLEASPARVPVLVGGSGSGRTTMLRLLGSRLPAGSVHTIDVERSASTPERFLAAILGSVPSTTPAPAAVSGTRESFEAVLAVLDQTTGPSGEPVTFLLDEFLELRTFESFPGLRRAIFDAVDRMAGSRNRFVLTSRYVARAQRLLRDRSARFELVQMPALTAEETDAVLRDEGAGASGVDREQHARTVQALTDGRPTYVAALGQELASMGRNGGGDAVSALVAGLAPGGRLARACEYAYELRLHRARGYGALKAILEILAAEEGLTLTEISLRLSRTPGSTKDYLSWLEDVDLLVARQKRYSYTDPLLRVWVRLHCRPTVPSDDDLAREVHRYAMPRLPHLAEPASAPAPQVHTVGHQFEDRRSSGIIEID